MSELKIQIKNPNKTPVQLANQFAQGVYGLSLSELAKKLIRELQEKDKP